ncbi:hypothetical protein CO218_01700 [Lactiplantibacillus plantarum]|uniref:Uncharacterized protein n=3 Tax=Lactiplantibacillus TaxID=2767842 RepID=A0A4Q9Y2E8_9LACO|nr:MULTISPECIES: hypothetical protein [Lactobacillaceae]MDN6545560.1 hypothetical protein [Enterococcaceae bacterium]TBX47336.1 hypothetical protein EUZ87_05065 [Lactiplantibacillus paraplantarum]ANJ13054.1 hypothetical protein A8704_03205 [Lactiplantibacillus plantarum]ASD32968.1 hypothetical protein CEF05_10155 [Lactiplantibacillus plantarum]AXI12179.1 hypothetical protein C6I22_05050 [Lactiplantibacillus plantarum]
MKYSRDQLMQTISSETDKVWDNGAALALISFVKEEIESTGQPLSQSQTDALAKSLTYISKANTKNSLIATFNVFTTLGIFKAN